MTAPRRLVPELWVGAPPTAYLMAQLAEWGIKSIINCRWDVECCLTLTAPFAKTEAERWGMTYAYAPVVDRLKITDDEIRVWEEAFARLPKPVYSYCRVGFRSVAVWGLSSLKDRDMDEIIEIAFDAGYDLYPLRPRFEQRLAFLRQQAKVA